LKEVRTDSDNQCERESNEITVSITVNSRCILQDCDKVSDA
jgi:hypothetical protein